MSKFIRVIVPPPVVEPRAARWAATLAVALGLACSRLVKSLRTPEPSSVPTDLHALASRVEREMPTLAVELRAIAMHQAKRS
jgi:hypothetical protein